MKRLAALLLLCLFAAAPARGGETVAFVPGAQVGGPEVLSHLELKSVITEFLDPQDTSLGKSLGYLVWSEVLSAISDQAGAGVILARPPGDQRVVDLLRSDYHEAALAIARHQRAPIALWGRVTEEGGKIIVDTACTLLPEVTDTALKVRLEAGKAGRGSQGPVIETEIPRTRFSFGWVETSRAALFNRAILTAANAELRAGPSEEAAVVARLPANRGLQAEGMEGAWFRVPQADGSVAYVHASKIRLPPAEVVGSGNATDLYARPDKSSSRVARRTLTGHHRVLDARYLATGVWYRLQVDGREGWVEGWRVTPVFSLPAVHFMAGLYRYFAGRYDDAAREFEQFLARAGSGTRNRVLATAQQLRAASLMLRERHAFSANKDAVVAALDEAARLTPYDPTSYTLRAVAELGIFPDPPKALAALRQALELDPEDRGARTLATTLERIAEDPGATQYRHLIHFDATDSASLRALSGR